MIISLLLLLPVYLPLAWIDWHLFRRCYGRSDVLAQLALLLLTVVVVAACHRLMQGDDSIWPYVLAPLLGYATMLLGFVVRLIWGDRR